MKRTEWAEDGDPVQVFVQPYEIKEIASGTLPAGSPAYLIHPCLNHYVSQVRNQKRSKEFLLLDFITVGHGKRWGAKHDYALELHRLIAHVSHPEIKGELKSLLASLPKINKDTVGSRLSQIAKRLGQVGDVASDVGKISELLLKLASLVR